MTTKNHVTYCGHDAVHVFVDHMVKLEDEITRVLCNPKPMELSEGETNDDRVELEILTDPDASVCGKRTWRGQSHDF